MRARPSCVALVATFAVACAEEPLRAHEALPMLREQLQPYGVQPEVASTAVAYLGWRAPSTECEPTYRILTEHEPDLMFEPDSISGLVLGPPRHADDRAPRTAFRVDGPAGNEAVASGRAYYRGFRAEERGVHRDWYLSELHAGPTAPTAACMPKTWDPVEDALTLGWPKLPGRLTGVGEHWRGLRVEAKCNRSACVDPQSGGGGPDNHHRTCVTMSWDNELAGVYEIDGHEVALIVSRWTDGHGPAEPGNDPDKSQGIWTERAVLVSLEHGRPIWARTQVHHNFAQPTADQRYAPILRTWEMIAIDECGGSLADLGWSVPADIAAQREDLRAKLQDDPQSRRRRSSSESTNRTPPE